MTPKLDFSDALSACRKINLECKEGGTTLSLYRPDGALLRTFDKQYIPARINGHDFAQWLFYMGYDK